MLPEEDYGELHRLAGETGVPQCAYYAERHSRTHQASRSLLTK